MAASIDDVTDTLQRATNIQRTLEHQTPHIPAIRLPAGSNIPGKLHHRAFENCKTRTRVNLANTGIHTPHMHTFAQCHSLKNCAILSIVFTLAFLVALRHSHGDKCPSSTCNSTCNRLLVGLLRLIRLHLAPLREEQEVLSVLRNSSPLSHLLHAFLALGAALQVALFLFVVLFFGGCWVALVLSCYVQPVS